MNIVVKDAKEKDNMKVDKKFLNRYKNTKELLITELNKSKAQKRFNNKITINNNIVEIDEKELLKLTLTQLKKISIEIFRNNHKSNTFQNDDNNIMINNEDIKESIKKILGDKRQKEYLIEHLKGSFVYINKDELKLDKNKFLSVDLIGFDVIINDKTIGVINDVLDTPANEVLVLDNNIMIPYVDAFIKEIDIKNKKVSVYEVKGLLS